MAEDVLQDALIDVYPRWSRLSAQGDPTGYVVRVMTSKVANRQRTSWVRRVISLPQDHGDRDGSTGDTVLASIDRMDIQRALLMLKPRQRSIVALHYLMDWPVADIAAALDVPVGTITSDLTRARTALRLHLGGEPHE